MPKTTARKRKLAKKSDAAAAAAATMAAESSIKISKKIKKQKKPKPPKSPAPDSDSDSDPNTEIQTLLEPFSKEQLVDLVIELASSDETLFSLVKSAADQDVSHRKIFIHGLGWDATRQLVESIFATYGEIEDLNVVCDRITMKCKGYAFLTYKSRKSAKKLLKNPRVQVGNRVTSCQLASEGPPGPGAGGVVLQKQFSASDFPQRKIYVSNVPITASPERLRVFFENFGEIENGPKGMDPVTGKFKGYAIFVFKTVEGAKKALEEPNKMFEGSMVNCRLATEGKGKVGGGAASITTAYQPMPAQSLAAVAAAQQVQNMALLGQQVGLVNPLYGGGLMANANLGALMGGYYGMMGGGVQGMGLGGGYGVSGSGGDGGSSAGMLQGLQYAYPSVQPGQPSSSLGKAPGADGSSYPLN